MMKINFTQSRLFSLILLSGALFFAACSDDESPAPVVPGQEGFFVVNAGAFNHNNSSLSFFSKDTDVVANDIFFSVNEVGLGDQAQSMTIIDGLGYIVVQNSSKIEVIDSDDYSSVATIDDEDGIISPRYIISVGENKAYVSDWGETGDNGTIKVLDLTTYKVTKTIQVGYGTNEMILVGGKVYATNKGGSNNQTFIFTKDTRVVVINPTTDEVEAEISVGDNPSAIEVDAEGDLWVAGGGNVVYNPDWSVNLEESTAGFLAEIDIEAETATTYTMDTKNAGPDKLAISADGATLYFNYDGGTRSLNTSVTGSSISHSSFINATFNGIDVDPSTGNFIGLKAPNFTSAGSLEIYDESGTLQNSYETGIGPIQAVFK